MGIQLILIINLFEIHGCTDVQLVLIIKMFEILGCTDVQLVLLIKMFEILGRIDVQILAGKLYLDHVAGMRHRRQRKTM